MSSPLFSAGSGREKRLPLPPPPRNHSIIKSFLGERLGRTLPDVDLPAWLSYLALDAGLREGDNEIQVLLVHGGEVSALPHCRPADLKELDGVACRTPLGEFAFSRVNTRSTQRSLMG